ncbi:hypothetical protein HOY80DRAFT_1042842 [Tuber brumale]|nr:hypothetical protein HOY80DRAFT_1042842 [Tuber brumale]
MKARHGTSPIPKRKYRIRARASKVYRYLQDHQKGRRPPTKDKVIRETKKYSRKEEELAEEAKATGTDDPGEDAAGKAGDDDDDDGSEDDGSDEEWIHCSLLGK